MKSVSQFLLRVAAIVGLGVVMAGLAGCGGGGADASSSTVTSSSIALPSSVQVVTAN